MEFLKLLEGIRNPFADAFFSLITHLGEETIFIIIGIFIFWCINKNKGYYILCVGFMGVVLNQALKITFRVPRPWVQDPAFTIVESARAEATGYSFPSGHTQISVGAYASMARCFKNTILRIICITLCVLVPLSRMYLGVHTPIDVIVSVALARLLTFGLYPVVTKAVENKKHMRILFAVIIMVSAVYLGYVELFNFPKDIDMANYISAMENAYKILGAMVGVWLGYEIDQKFIRFETQAVWWAQILKVLVGVIPLLLIKSFLKAPLSEVFGPGGNLIRYFLITTFACGIWPFTFKFFRTK